MIKLVGSFDFTIGNDIYSVEIDGDMSRDEYGADADGNRGIMQYGYDYVIRSLKIGDEEIDEELYHLYEESIDEEIDKRLLLRKEDLYD